MNIKTVEKRIPIGTLILNGIFLVLQLIFNWELFVYFILIFNSMMHIATHFIKKYGYIWDMYAQSKKILKPFDKLLE